MHGYIPDASFVGTIFVNAIANILTTAAIDVILNVVDTNNNITENIVGDFNFSSRGKTLQIEIGTVRYG